MAATPTAAFPALATRVPSAHLFTHAQFARSTHTSSGNRNKCTLSCEHTITHNCIRKSRGTYVNQINIYCSLCMVENLKNIRQAHQARATNMNKDIIYTEERNKNLKIQNIPVPTACKQWQMQILRGSTFFSTSIMWLIKVTHSM